MNNPFEINIENIQIIIQKKKRQILLSVATAATGTVLYL